MMKQPCRSKRFCFGSRICAENLLLETTESRNRQSKDWVLSARATQSSRVLAHSDVGRQCPPHCQPPAYGTMRLQEKLAGGACLASCEHHVYTARPTRLLESSKPKKVPPASPCDTQRGATEDAKSTTRPNAAASKCSEARARRAGAPNNKAERMPVPLYRQLGRRTQMSWTPAPDFSRIKWQQKILFMHVCQCLSHGLEGTQRQNILQLAL